MFLRVLKRPWHLMLAVFFFFNDTATTEIYTLSLHDALPICLEPRTGGHYLIRTAAALGDAGAGHDRSEEHTSELQSQSNLVCRLLLEKKKKLQRHTYDTSVIYSSR